MYVFFMKEISILDYAKEPLSTHEYTTVLIIDRLENSQYLHYQAGPFLAIGGIYRRSPRAPS